MIFETLTFVVALATASSALLPSVKNLRPLTPLLYRAASLDNLSQSDAEKLLNGNTFGTPLTTVIDLRNSDEIKKGEKVRSEGSEYFYESLPKIVHVPILKDVDAFWDEAINRMSPQDRTVATLQTVWQGGALDRAAARNLEKGGLAMLYTIMLETSMVPIRTALETCLQETELGGCVIFHCQKGKDRTGVLSMLIQSCLGEEKEKILKDYCLSGKLLDEEDPELPQVDASSSASGGGRIDWGYFRGSPKSAMEDTIEWMKERYGSVDSYLDAASFSIEQRKALRENLLQGSEKASL